MATAASARTWAAVAFAGLLGAVLAIALLRRNGAERLLGQQLARRTRLAMVLLALGSTIFALGVHQV